MDMLILHVQQRNFFGSLLSGVFDRLLQVALAVLEHRH
jgi:hypothetical protein